MSAADNLAMHSRWAAAENAQDLSHHGEFIHDDIEFHQPGVEPIVGLAAYIAMMNETYAGLGEFHSDIEDSFATDDRVVCRWRTSGVHTGDFFGLPPTGKRIEFAGVSVWEIEDGRARRGYAYPDVVAVMTQLSAG